MSTDRMLSPALPSMGVLVTCTLLMTGEHSIGSVPAVAAHLSWSAELKVMAHWDHLSGRVASSLGRTAFTSRANCLKMRCEARASAPPRMQAIARGSWEPPTPSS